MDRLGECRWGERMGIGNHVGTVGTGGTAGAGQAGRGLRAKRAALTAADADGRSQVSPLPGSHALGIPGRPTLPAFAVTLALPPDGRPSARVIAASGEQARDGVRLEVAGRPAFRDEGPGGLGIQPTVETVA